MILHNHTRFLDGEVKTIHKIYRRSAELPVCENELSSRCYTVAFCGFHTPQHQTAAHSERWRHWSEDFLLCRCQCGVITWLGRAQTLLNIFEPYLLLREDKTGLDSDRFWILLLKVCVKSACLTTSVRFGFYRMRKDVPLNPASLRTGQIETEEVVVYKGAWPCILRYTDSGALRRTAVLMLLWTWVQMSTAGINILFYNHRSSRASLSRVEVRASVQLFVQWTGVPQLQGFSWVTATFTGKSSC